MQLPICHLYPDLMNIYGDRGNSLTLVERCRRRGITVTVSDISLGDQLDPDAYDLYFFGGGQDQEQMLVSEDLQRGKGAALREAIEDGAALLSICGGYQLLGHFFRPFEGPEIPGVGLFDAWTVASRKRKIGNIVIRLKATADHGPLTSPPCARPPTPSPPPSTGEGVRKAATAAGVSAAGGRQSAVFLVGFENHSGNTYLGPGCRPLGRVQVGFGNNGEDGTEGAVYKNAFGCYLHGSVLPKNPHFADHLIRLALRRRYGDVELTPLDDTLEWEAHRSAIQRARETRLRRIVATHF